MTLAAAFRAAVLAAAVPFATPAAQAASLAEAERAWAAGERAEAGRLVRAWAAEDPAARVSGEGLALLARTAEDPDEAFALWDQVLALSPPEELAAEAVWQKGLVAYSAGRYVAAAETFGLLDREYSKEVPAGRALLWRGCAQLAADQPAEALDTLRQAERSVRGDDVPSVQFALAHAQFRLGQVGDALRRYERFEREHRDDGRASAAARRTVECLRMLGREAEASTRAAHIEREYPDSFEATLAREAIRSREDTETGAEESDGKVGPARWIVQVAAMTDPANATRLAGEVRARKLGDVRIERAEGPEGTMHRVLLGPFDDEARARAAADSVKLLGEDLAPRVREEPAK